jgi:putative transposase
MMMEHKISARKACNAVRIDRKKWSYKTVRKRTYDNVIAGLTAMTEKHPSIGFWQCYFRLRNQGHTDNHKRIYRIYTSMKLNIRRRAKKRLPARVKQMLYQPDAPNKVWNIDFMTDSLWHGRTFHTLNVIDDFNRRVLAIEADTSLPALRVVRVLERLKETRGLPEMIRVDNGPEFISAKLDIWCKDHHIKLVFIQPGEPTENAYIERFNGSFRRELLNAYVFRSLQEFRVLAD